MEKSNKLIKRVAIGFGVLSLVGILSQQVENSLDKEAIKEYVETNFEESNEKDEHINFEIGDQEASISEYLGF
ncbi:MAG: hypothetical protein ACK5LC_14395 [Coprobacillaceae bacterium]